MRTLLSVCLFVALPCAFANSSSIQGQCSRDSDCASGTVCVHVRFSAEYVVGKCTPSTKAVPACRGLNFGRCPSYQEGLEVGNAELNTQCVFVNTTKVRNVECCSKTVKDGCFECYNIGEKFYAGTYECVPKKQCNARSAFKEACNNIDCKPSKDSLCSNQGTCAQSDKDDPRKSYKCICYKGYGGGVCEKTVSNECSVDCGKGGQRGLCQGGKCVCKAGWKGTQCSLCTSDKVCNSDNNGGKCNKESGQCVCNTGFNQHPRCLRKTSGGAKACKKDCGPNGSCLAGECVCRYECRGGLCPKCKTSFCTECALASSLQPLVIATVAIQLILTFILF